MVKVKKFKTRKLYFKGSKQATEKFFNSLNAYKHYDGADHPGDPNDRETTTVLNANPEYISYIEKQAKKFGLKMTRKEQKTFEDLRSELNEAADYKENPKSQYDINNLQEKEVYIQLGSLDDAGKLEDWLDKNWQLDWLGAQYDDGLDGIALAVDIKGSGDKKKLEKAMKQLRVKGRIFESKQKPYVSKVGSEWIVMDSNGKDVMKTKDKKAAEKYLDKHYNDLMESDGKPLKIKAGMRIKSKVTGKMGEVIKIMDDGRLGMKWDKGGRNKIVNNDKVIEIMEENLHEAKTPKAMYDISDFPEDGLDDMMWGLSGMGKAKQGKDWDIDEMKGKLHLHLYTPIGVKAAEKFFGKNASELVK